MSTYRFGELVGPGGTTVGPSQQYGAGSYGAQAAQRSGAAGPPKIAWWYDGSGNKQSKLLDGEVAGATGIATVNGQLKVTGPFGERFFDSTGKSVGAAGAASAAADAKAPPKFNVIAKDPLTDAAAMTGLANVQAGNKQASTMYDDWLGKFKQDAAQGEQRLLKETNTYDTAAANLKSSLSSAFDRQKANLDALSANDVLKAGGYTQGRALQANARSGGADMGASSEEMGIYASALAQAKLPYAERLGQLDRENIMQGYQADLSTAGLSRSAQQQAAMASLLPINTSLSLLGQQQQNLGNAVNLLSSGRSVWSDDPRLVPQLPTPSGSYNLPGASDYGGRDPVRQSGYGVGRQQFVQPVAPPVVPNTGFQPRRSEAEIAYHEQTGKWPMADRYFNSELWASLGGRLGANRQAATPLSPQFLDLQRNDSQERMAAINAEQEARAWDAANPNRFDYP